MSTPHFSEPLAAAAPVIENQPTEGQKVEEDRRKRARMRDQRGHANDVEGEGEVEGGGRPKERKGEMEGCRDDALEGEDEARVEKRAKEAEAEEREGERERAVLMPLRATERWWLVRSRWRKR